MKFSNLFTFSLLLILLLLELSSCSENLIESVPVNDYLPNIEAQSSLKYEGDSTNLVTINLSMDRPSTETVFLGYNTVDNTATSDLDFIHQTGTIYFYPGETKKSFSFSILGDIIPEQNERVEILFFAASNAQIITPQIFLTIIDDD
jgi:hypothetical protein